jgi:hypothetical protein
MDAHVENEIPAAQWSSKIKKQCVFLSYTDISVDKNSNVCELCLVTRGAMSKSAINLSFLSVLTLTFQQV